MAVEIEEGSRQGETNTLLVCPDLSRAVVGGVILSECVREGSGVSERNGSVSVVNVRQGLRGHVTHVPPPSTLQPAVTGHKRRGAPHWPERESPLRPD